VKCAYPAEASQQLSRIIDNPNLRYSTPSGEKMLPFVNHRTRTQVRVVDFYPPDLKDFTQSLDQSAYNDYTSTPDEVTMIGLNESSPQPSRWEWSFYLLIEDAKPSPGQKIRLPLLVAGKDAEYLLQQDAAE
jgi:protection-of-telomeres protein 1